MKMSYPERPQRPQYPDINLDGISDMGKSMSIDTVVSEIEDILGEVENRAESIHGYLHGRKSSPDMESLSEPNLFDRLCLLRNRLQELCVTVTESRDRLF